MHRDEVFTSIGREGAGRMTLFASQSNARTWDFQVRAVASILEQAPIQCFRLEMSLMCLHLMVGPVSQFWCALPTHPLYRTLCGEHREYDSKIPRDIQNRPVRMIDFTIRYSYTSFSDVYQDVSLAQVREFTIALVMTRS